MAGQTFKDKLRAELDRQGISVTELARRLTVKHPGRLESVRRRLNKYLAGYPKPTGPTRHEIEAALNVTRDTLKPDDHSEVVAAVASAIPLTVFIDPDVLLQALHAAKGLT